jgi:alpha-tubulin suppressor-like RCC1 family protein
MTSTPGARIAIAAAMAALAAASCHHESEIVLVIDTDLTIPTDIDSVEISVSGATTVHEPIIVNLVASGAPTFPLTLGLLSGGALSPVTINVVGKAEGVEVAHQDASSAFVEGERRMLRMLLLTSCLTTICPTNQSCGSSGCVPVDRPASSLPGWTGVPARPDKPMTTPLAGRTVWASGWHSCAIDGPNLYAWGQNSDGQLGTGTTQSANSRRLVMNIRNPASIGLGGYHSCACDKSKQAWCWGRNTQGQLATGDLISTRAPVAVPGLTDCEQIAAGASHTCAVRTDKTVSCWGLNTSGQVGQPVGPDLVMVPQPVPNLTNVAEVQCGEFFTCARTEDGAILCWGRNDAGQLGDGTMVVARANPAPVVGLPSDIAELVTGRFFACARHATGHVSCWGNNSNGQLGNTSANMSNVPIDIAVVDGTQLAAGLQHACVLHRTGTLSCWGGNQSGQLGNGMPTGSIVPVDVVQISGVTSIAAGSIHTCARYSKGLACWGDNQVNQLGDGSVLNRATPVSVAGFGL